MRSTPDLVLGLSGATRDPGAAGDLGSGSPGPYAGTHYAGMQPVTVVVDGVTYTGYANVWCTSPDQQGDVYG